MATDAYPRLVLTGGAEDVLLQPAPLAGGERNEAWLRDFILRHPLALPTAEIDPAFAAPVAICSELRTPAGPIDALLVNRHGALVLVECKLFRNPQARREVVGQILDYAKEIARWRYSDLQAAVSQRLGQRGENALHRLVAEHHPEVAEASFVDAVSRNLARGRFMLLIAGDGIRQETEAIAEYIQDHASLRFTLGLVEMRGFAFPDGRLLVQPRLLARTVMLERQVLVAAEAPATPSALSGPEEDNLEGPDPPQEARGRMLAEDRTFWTLFASRLVLDDPAQPIPSARGLGNARASLGHPDIWLTVFRSRGWGQIGVFARFRGVEGRRVYDALSADAAAIEAEIRPHLGAGTLTRGWTDSKNAGFIEAIAKESFEPPAESEERHLAWLLPMTNAFVNAMRPRIRAVLSGSQTKG